MTAFARFGFGIALLAATGLAHATPAPPVSALRDGIRVGELQAILNKAGMQSTLAQTPTGTAFLSAVIPETSITILIAGIGCHEPTACEGFGAVVWNSQPATSRLINEYNEKCCYVRAVIETDGQARLVGDYVARGGITDQNIVADIQSFIDGMNRYTELRGGASADLGTAPGTQAAPAAGNAFAEAGKKLGAAEHKFVARPRITAKYEKLIDGWLDRPMTP
jgi:hypothetical protein